MKKFLCVFLGLALMASAVFAEDVVKLGAIGPLTGESSIAGIDERDSKLMAIDEINAVGGLLGRKVVMYSEDDASQPSQAAAVAMKMISQNNVVAIIGAHNSSCTLAIMQIIDRAGIPIIPPSSTSPKVCNSGNKWVVRPTPPDTVQTAALVQYAKELGYKKIGMIYVNDDFGKGGYGAVLDAMKAQGMELAGAESFQGDDKDMHAQLTKLKALGVDALLIWCQFVPASLIMRQAREMGWNVQFFGGTGPMHNRTFELAGGAYDGMIHTVPFIPNNPLPNIQKYVGDFQKRYGRIPSQPGARAYDAINLYFDAVKRAGTTDPDKVIVTLRSTKDFPSLQGPITINKDTGEYEGGVPLVKANYENKNWDFIKNFVPQMQSK